MSGIPFSHSVPVRDIPPGGKFVHLEAGPEERTALAEALGIPAVEALEAELELRPVRGRAISVRGAVRGRVVQTCVVTLEPVTQEVLEPVEVELVEEERGARRERKQEIYVDAFETDVPDLYSNGRIDLGVIASEHLALGLDPYPRAEGIGFADHVEAAPEAERSPFAALRALKTEK
ncbi:YceD family protein [Faunimonas sp. B44]|uniref:YceD family protein n=1 Tax=Faunimonas sp. B44 TaxID=3461493 RepID=UPI004044C9E8